MQFIRRLALEALQLRNVQTRILLNNQLVIAHVDSVQRSHCLFGNRPCDKTPRQQDLSVGAIRFHGFFQPFLLNIELVGKQSNATQLKCRRIVLWILSDDLRVKFAGLGKLPRLKEPISRIDF